MFMRVNSKCAHQLRPHSGMGKAVEAERPGVLGAPFSCQPISSVGAIRTF